MTGLLKQFWSDDTGLEAMEKIIIAAFIIIPLVMTLILFRDKITTFLDDKWEDLVSANGSSG